MDALGTLCHLLSRSRRLVVAYSGGVDSAFLSDVAHEVTDARIVTAVSASLAPRERAAAASLAAARGWRHEEIETRELDREAYRRNDTDRCFHCKDTLFDVLDVLAIADGATVCVGTNLDDLGDHRPGLRAAAEHQVAQPLVEAGFTKAMIREAAAARGLPVAAKPASPCLASRIAYGTEVTVERLARIAAAEELLWAEGVGDVRVRDLGDVASIEVPLDDLGRLDASARIRLVDAMRALGYEHASFDPRGLRSGALNELVGITRRPTPPAPRLG